MPSTRNAHWTVGALQLGSAFLVAACGVPRRERADAAQPSSHVTREKGTKEAPPAPKPGSRALAVRLLFDDKGLHVRLTAAAGTPAELGAWKLGDDEVEQLDVHDASDHPVAFRRNGRTVEIDAPPARLVLTYDVKLPVGRKEKAEADAKALKAVEDPRSRTEAYDARAAIDEDPRASLIDPNRLRVCGERVLAIPAAFESKVLDAEVELDARPIEAPVAATSFGVGRGQVSRTFSAPGTELRRAVFVAGGGGRADFDAPEGRDESAWLGYPAFDPRAVSAEIAGFRGVLHEYFKSTEGDPATTFFVVDSRARSRFRVLRRARGVLVALAASDPYDATLRLGVAHELVHAFIGERIWVGDSSPGREAESFWFHEGFTRWLAREQLARVGLLSSDEYVAEMNRVIGIATVGKPGTPLAVARGVLFATLADARVREATKGARSLDDVLRAVAKRAFEARGPLPADAVTTALAAEIGDAKAKDDFADVVTTGKRVRLPADALGGCFDAREGLYDVRDEGFDLPGSRASGVVSKVEPKSAAARAGLRDGDMLVAAEIPETKGAKARVDVDRDGKRMTFTFDPVAGTKRGQTFRRKPALSEDACRKLALRK